MKIELDAKTLWIKSNIELDPKVFNWTKLWKNWTWTQSLKLCQFFF